MLKEYDKHDKVIHTLNSTTDTYFDQGSYLSLRRGECTNAGIRAQSLIRPLSNARLHLIGHLVLDYHGSKEINHYIHTCTQSTGPNQKESEANNEALFFCSLNPFCDNTK